MEIVSLTQLLERIGASTYASAIAALVSHYEPAPQLLDRMFSPAEEIVSNIVVERLISADIQQQLDKCISTLTVACVAATSSTDQPWSPEKEPLLLYMARNPTAHIAYRRDRTHDPVDVFRHYYTRISGATAC